MESLLLHNSTTTVVAMLILLVLTLIMPIISDLVTVKSEPTTLGMMDRSRMVLCMFMFTILIVNPFSKTFSLTSESAAGGEDYMRQHGGGRNVLDYEGHGKVTGLHGLLKIRITSS